MKPSELKAEAERQRLAPKAQAITVGDELAGDQYARKDWQARIEAGDVVLSGLAAAHRQFFNYHRDLREAFDRRDPELTPDAHFMAIKRLGEQTLARAGQASDAARERAEGELTAIRASLQTQLGLTETHRAGEIRAMLRGATDKDRSAILQAAVTAMDGETVAAVIEAPAYLSGLTAEQAQALRTQYERTHGGDLPARADALDRAIAVNRKAALQALQFQGALLPAERAREIEARQQAARAMRERLATGG